MAQALTWKQRCIYVLNAIVDAYTSVCIWLQSLFLAALLLRAVIANRRNDSVRLLSAHFTDRTHVADFYHDITGFVTVWAATQHHSFGSLYRFLNAAVRRGHLQKVVLERDITLIIYRSGIIVHAVINLSGEEKELLTNADITSMSFHVMPGKPITR